MKVSSEVRRLAKYKKKKEFSVATLHFDVTFCTPIPCAPSLIKCRRVVSRSVDELPKNVSTNCSFDELSRFRTYRFCWFCLEAVGGCLKFVKIVVTQPAEFF